MKALSAALALTIVVTALVADVEAQYDDSDYPDEYEDCDDDDNDCDLQEPTYPGGNPSPLGGLGEVRARITSALFEAGIKVEIPIKNILRRSMFALKIKRSRVNPANQFYVLISPARRHEHEQRGQRTAGQADGSAMDRERLSSCVRDLLLNTPLQQDTEARRPEPTPWKCGNVQLPNFIDYEDRQSPTDFLDKFENFCLATGVPDSKRVRQVLRPH
ncbi:hypothetical protein HPB47_011335 [Ixodes persulcatus]|uniref:Uncharacterized protein n=1 Tax=Ixodes persulcatus TaxID=34615 RepID=A0AC60NWY2_IXOPE|nr:hypothetical protein HPB47_011335 [Ixodes persulcatus]